MDRRPAVLLVGQRGADRGGRGITDAVSAVAADELMIFGEVPEPRRPAAQRIGVAGDERPVFILDLGPELGGHARGRYRTSIPAPCRLIHALLPHLLRLFRDPVASLLEHATA